MSQRINFFSQSEVIVMEYGAAMVNLLFCRSTPKVVVIKPPNKPQPQHDRALVEGLGMTFQSVIGKRSICNAVKLDFDAYNVDVEALERLINTSPG